MKMKNLSKSEINNVRTVAVAAAVRHQQARVRVNGLDVAVSYGFERGSTEQKLFTALYNNEVN